MAKKLILYADGASRGNPGLGGAGAVLKDKTGKTLEEITYFVGQAVTNNVAEYTALLVGLEKALELETTEIDIFMDSELVVRQIKGEYQVKNEKLLEIFVQVQRLLKKFSSYKIQHIPREKNKEADRLSNQAINLRDMA
ncbi:MAG: ribonuclease HI family protein [Deltaproteobacteria bacterium]|nr:ribonuclease HI family protein [Deltaproteobacteria bacterium]